MKFLWISKYLDTMPLAIRLQDEGNDVKVCCLDPKRKICGDGLINKVDDWRKHLEKDRVCVFDMVGSGLAASNLKRQGYPVFGASPLADKLELDRVFGTQTMNTAGIKTPHTESFTDWGKAEKYVYDTQQKYVFKPSGNMGCALTYVAFNGKDMLNFLKEIQGQITKKVEFELQSVQEGEEVSCEGLFNGKEWIDGWCNITFEEKAALTGGLGHLTGCAQDVVKVLPDQVQNKMFQKTLARITPMLQAADYRGLIDINCIYTNGVPFGLEWTPRFGINAIYTMMELVKDDMGKIIADTALGNSFKVKTDRYGFAASVRTTVPESPKIPRRLVQNILNFKHVHPMDIMLGPDGDFVTCDVDFIIAVVTGYGSTIEKASDRCYHLLKKTENFGILDLEYRLDCGKAEEASYNRLRQWGLV